MSLKIKIELANNNNSSLIDSNTKIDQDNPNRISHTLGENRYLENATSIPNIFKSNNNNNNNNDDENNSCDENGEKSINENTTLKRKRLCDIAYTAEATFDTHNEATKYVDAMGIWKFERNRPTKKGSKGFYYCKMSEACKSKIYLLSDPFSKKVILFQNNIEHDHNGYNEISSQPAKKSRVSLVNKYNNNNNDFDNDINNENPPVDVVNENDYDDSFVDFFDNQNENENDDANLVEAGNAGDMGAGMDDDIEYSMVGWPENGNEDVNSKSVNASNRFEVNYTAEKSFPNRQMANEYLETVYSGIWKFQRTRSTKMGAKGFFKCKLSNLCKSKVYLLSHPNSEQITLFTNNIEHDHTGKAIVVPNIASNIKSDSMHIESGADNNNKVDVTRVDETAYDEDSFEYGPINCISGDDNTNEQFEDDDNDQGNGSQINSSTRRRTNLVNRFELTYTAEESFENRQLANEFIDSLSIWKFQRTRSTKKGAKCFYVCKLSDMCKSKIYVLSHPDSEQVTVFRNNIDHDHTQTKAKTANISSTINSNIEALAEFNNDPASKSFVKILPAPIKDQEKSYAYTNNESVYDTSYMNQTDIENEDALVNKSQKSTTGTRFEFNYSAERTFDNRQIATKYVDSLGVWKFERTRSTKKGSKGFYHCRILDSCKSKIYLLSTPNTEKITLYRNNIEHDHTNQSISKTPNNLKPTMIRQPLSKTQSCDNGYYNNVNNQINDDDYEQESEENMNDIGPLKYFINNQNTNEYDEEEENGMDEYGSASDNNNNNGSEYFENGEEDDNENRNDFYEQNEDSDDGDLNYKPNKTFGNRQLANDYINDLDMWKFQRTKCTKRGAKCFYRCKLSQMCQSKIYVLTQPNTEQVVLYSNNIQHDHSSYTNGHCQNGNGHTKAHMNDNDSDIIENELFNDDGEPLENSSENFFPQNDNNLNGFANDDELEDDFEDENFDMTTPEENFFSDENSNNRENCDGESENKINKTGGRIDLVYIADETFENRQLANRFVDSLGIWKFDRLRDTKTGAKGFYQCKVSDFCKSKIYLLFHPDSDRVTLYKNNIEHDHTHKKSKKWGLSTLTKKLIDEAYLNGNTKPMSCLFKVRSLIKEKSEKLAIEKAKGNDVVDLQNELDQLEVPGMTVLKNYINNTLKPKLNGNKDTLSPESNGNNSVTKFCLLNGNGSNYAYKQNYLQNSHLSKRILHLEQVNKTLMDELEKEREYNKEILNKLEIANNKIKNSELPKEENNGIDLDQPVEVQLKKQQATIELLQKKIEELSAENEKFLTKQNNIATNIEKLICDNDVCEYF